MGNFEGFIMRGIDLSLAELSGSNFRGAQLPYANLRCIDLSGADLTGANLDKADLRGADLNGANLTGANIERTDLRGANLSGVIGLRSAKEFLSTFERDEDGAIICYKTFGEKYDSPADWDISVGSFITEVCNPNRVDEYGCGINVATLDWVQRKRNGVIWKCRILPEDFLGGVVPYTAKSIFRAERVQLVECLG